MKAFPFVSVLTLLPIFGAIVVAGLRPEQKRLTRGMALGFGLMVLVLALVLWTRFQPALSGLQFEEAHNWIPVLAVATTWGWMGSACC